jgi:hypothetical protein
MIPTKPRPLAAGDVVEPGQHVVETVTPVSAKLEVRDRPRACVLTHPGLGDGQEFGDLASSEQPLGQRPSLRIARRPSLECSRQSGQSRRP